jgi:hypothetical protein
MKYTANIHTDTLAHIHTRISTNMSNEKKRRRRRRNKNHRSTFVFWREGARER